MTDEIQDELIANAINSITEKVSKVMLDEFLKLPAEMQLNMVLIKSAQLLLSNVLCHVAINKTELDKIANSQGEELRDLTLSCAYSGFADKFNFNKH